MTFTLGSKRLARIAAALAIVAIAALVIHSQQASSKSEDREAQAATMKATTELYPALAAGTDMALSAEETERVVRTAAFGRAPGSYPVGRVVIQDTTMRARVVTNGPIVCLWITYPDSSGSLGCRPADGESFGALDVVANGQLRFTGVLGTNTEASVNGEQVPVSSGTFTRLVNPGDRVTMGANTQVVRKP